MTPWTIPHIHPPAHASALTPRYTHGPPPPLTTNKRKKERENGIAVAQRQRVRFPISWVNEASPSYPSTPLSCSHPRALSHSFSVFPLPTSTVTQLFQRCEPLFLWQAEEPVHTTSLRALRKYVFKLHSATHAHTPCDHRTLFASVHELFALSSLFLSPPLEKWFVAVLSAVCVIEKRTYTGFHRSLAIALTVCLSTVCDTKAPVSFHYCYSAENRLTGVLTIC